MLLRIRQDIVIVYERRWLSSGTKLSRQSWQLAHLYRFQFNNHCDSYHKSSNSAQAAQHSSPTNCSAVIVFQLVSQQSSFFPMVFLKHQVLDKSCNWFSLHLLVTPANKLRYLQRGYNPTKEALSSELNCAQHRLNLNSIHLSRGSARP